MASFRLRVSIPARHIGFPYVIGAPGNPTFFFKNGDLGTAKSIRCPIVYDVVNDHFCGDNDYKAMCDVADKITRKLVEDYDRAKKVK